MTRSLAIPLLCAGLPLIAACAERSVDTLPAPDALAPVGVPYSLPRGLMPLTIELNAEGVLTVKPEALILTPDPASRLVARLKPSAFATDNTKITVSQGLLTTVNAKNADRTPEIVKKLAEIAQTAAPIGGRATGIKAEPYKFQLLVDPFNPRLHEAALRGYGQGYDQVIKIRALDLNGQPLNGPELKGEPGVPGRGGPNDTTLETCGASLCFPLWSSVIVSVEVASLSYQFGLVVPDPRRVGRLDVTRAACVEKTTGASFDKGMLTGLDVAQPSSLEGCLSIPLDILKAVVAVPGSILESQTADLDAETKLLNARASLLAAQQGLLDAQAKLTPPVP